MKVCSINSIIIALFLLINISFSMKLKGVKCCCNRRSYGPERLGWTAILTCGGSKANFCYKKETFKGDICLKNLSTRLV